jgi:hypothetical protein
MSRHWLNFLLVSAALVAPHAAWGQPKTAQTPTIAEKTAGAQKLPGYFKTVTRHRPNPRTAHLSARMTIGMTGAEISAGTHVTNRLFRRL